MSLCHRIFVEVSAGELIDKITVLRVKRRRISEAAKLRNIQIELGVLAEAERELLGRSAELPPLADDLCGVNAELYDVISAIYECEKSGDFSARFVELARAVYRLNDRRALLKRKINELTASRIVEEKGHCIDGADQGAAVAAKSGDQCFKQLA